MDSGSRGLAMTRLSRSSRDPARWEEVGYIEIDAATAGFGDAHAVKLLADQPKLFHFVKPVQPFPGIEDWQRVGIPFIAAFTRADVACPIERAFDTDGRVGGLRVEFVNDVENSKGEWREVGRLIIFSGRCVVADPYCMRSEQGAYQRELGAPTGSHSVQAFYWEQDQDLLGLRILFSEPLARPKWGVD